MTHRFPRRLAIAAASAVSLTLTSCVRIPVSSEPMVLGSFVPSARDQQLVPPTPGGAPDALVREFLSQSANPAQNYAAAKQYLAPSVAETWQPEQAGTRPDTGLFVVLDEQPRIQVYTSPVEPHSDTREVSVSSQMVGTLSQTGVFTPASRQDRFAFTFEMRRIDGQWRITTVPLGLAIPRDAFQVHYSPTRLYFFNEQSTRLVPERRWIRRSQEDRASIHAQLLTLGPSNSLAPALRPPLPEALRFVGHKDDILAFTGAAELDQPARERFVAELVWTLAKADVRGPYRITFDGSPYTVEGDAQLTTDMFAAWNPSQSRTANAPLFALHDGALFKMDGATAVAAEEPIGGLRDISSIEIGPEKLAALVRENNGRAELWFGGLGRPLISVTSTETLTRPSHEAAERAVWVVADGTRVLRATRPTADGPVAIDEINAREVWSAVPPDAKISFLRLSPSGARLALIVGGVLYVGVIAGASGGERRITSVRAVAPTLAGDILSVAWNEDGSLIVGTNRPADPVWQIAADGSEIAALPSGGATAEIVAVASAGNMRYATDKNRLLQLPLDGNQNFWQEVPGLEGVRAIAVVAQ